MGKRSPARVSFARRPQPTYRKLADQLRNDVLRGVYVGRRLPTEAELTDRWDVSRHTVRRAFEELVAEGVVFRTRRRGTFGCATPGQYLRSFGTIEDLLALSEDTVLEVIDPLHLKVNVEAASRLQLAGDQVLVATFRRLHEERPFSVTTVYLPLEIGRPLLASNALGTVGHRSPMTVIGSIEQVHHLAILAADQSITATAADRHVARRIECYEGDPVLRIDRLYSDSAGTAVELAISHLNPARYSYRIRIRRNPR